jgi:hypothetical protein
VRCFGFGWDLVSAVAAGFVGRGKFGNGLYNAFNGWMLRFEGRGSREESWKGEKTRKASMGE